MPGEELFVGGVAIVLGLLTVITAAADWDWYYQRRLGRWIESRWGRTAARACFGTLGLILIGLGIAIAIGFGPNKSNPAG